MSMAKTVMMGFLGVALVSGALLASPSLALAKKSCTVRLTVCNTLGRAFNAVAVSYTFKGKTRAISLKTTLGKNKCLTRGIPAGKHKNGCKGTHNFTLKARCTVGGKELNKSFAKKDNTRNARKINRTKLTVGDNKYPWAECK